MHLIQMSSNNGTGAMQIVTSGVNKNIKIIDYTLIHDARSEKH